MPLGTNYYLWEVSAGDFDFLILLFLPRDSREHIVIKFRESGKLGNFIVIKFRDSGKLGNFEHLGIMYRFPLFPDFCYFLPPRCPPNL